MPMTLSTSTSPTVSRMLSSAYSMTSVVGATSAGITCRPTSDSCVLSLHEPHPFLLMQVSVKLACCFVDPISGARYGGSAMHEYRSSPENAMLRRLAIAGLMLVHLSAIAETPDEKGLESARAADSRAQGFD